MGHLHKMYMQFETEHLGKECYSFQESIWPFLGNSVQLLPDKWDMCRQCVKADVRPGSGFGRETLPGQIDLSFPNGEIPKSEAASFLFWKGNICLEKFH